MGIGSAIYVGPSSGGAAAVVVADAAALAAYADAGLANNFPAWVATFDDGFTLRRDSIAAPDNILVIAASSGVGNWERNQIPAYKWQTQASWFISNAGSDENSGKTNLLPVKTHAEIRRRIGPVPLVDLDIEWMNDSTEDVVFDWGGDRFVFEHHTQGAALFSGTISAAPQNWDGALRRDAQITCAGLPVSWTASGLLHKFGVLTSGASSGMSFFVGQDLAAKTARVSIPCDVPGYTFAEGAFANTNTFQIFEIPTLSGYCTFSPRLRPGFFSLQNLRLGADGMTSQNELDLGVAFCLNCILNGTAISNGGNIQAIGCYVASGIVGAGSGLLLQASCIEDALTVTGGEVSVESSWVQNSAGYGIIASASAKFILVGSFFGHVSASSGAIFTENSHAVSRNGFYWFGKTVANVGINMGPGCNVGFDRNFRPAFGAVGVSQSYIGGAPKTFAEWPYGNEIAASTAYLNAGDVPLEDYIPLSANQQTASAVYVDMPGVTDTFTILGTRRVNIDFTAQIGADVGAQPQIQLVIDGAAQPNSAGAGIVAGPQNVSTRLRVSLNSGGHTVKVQWKNGSGSGGNIYCRPATVPAENAILRITESII